RPVEVDALHRSGAVFPVELTISRVEGAGEEVAFVAFARDVRGVRQAQAELREARDTFRLAFQASPMGIVMAALDDFAWLEVNPSFCAMLGYEEAELRQLTFLDLTHPADRAITAADARRVRAREIDTLRVERRYLRKDGSTMWVDVTVSLLRDAGDEPRCYLAQILDITERKVAEEALRESERQLTDAQALGAIGSWERDHDTNTTVWSAELKRMFGIAADAPAPQTVEEFLAMVHPDDRADVSEAVHQVPGEHDYRIVRPDGEVRWMSGRRRLASAEPLRIAGTMQDITDRKRIEEELRRSNAALEQYAHAASHDLASPLTTISGFASLLRMRHADALNEDALRYLEAIERGTERMRAMLDAMLQYASAQRGEREVEDVDLGAVAGEVLADLRATIADTGADVAVDTLPTVSGERALLRQVLLNLVANALKYTPPGEPPRVRITGTRRAPAHWEIAVEDRGIGIPPEQAEKAFELFTRLPGGTAYPGTGMGLALCLKVVERHGGRIWIDPTPGGGTTVRFTLPA
ncbi:MAG TPA: PAS domain S-box protein, partial [Solirubrobacteraceae bacterium]|nr:PAS domain S-box protein [Solirubrobacteraceae bacterium]